MSCCDTKNAIVVVKGDDTNFYGQRFLTLYINTSVYDLSTMKAKFSIFGIDKIFDDISSGEINIDYTAAQTAEFPIGLYNGVLTFYDENGRKAVAESFIPFCVIANVHGDAIATRPYEMTINVEQGGENVMEINVQAGVSVEVIPEVETLPAGSQASVVNVGTPAHLVLRFSIPQGEKGDQGPAGPAGQPAKIIIRRL